MDKLQAQIVYLEFVKQRIKAGFNPNRKGIDPQSYLDFWKREERKTEAKIEAIRMAMPAKK
jgi:hypothetical protein